MVHQTTLNNFCAEHWLVKSKSSRCFPRYGEFRASSRTQVQQCQGLFRSYQTIVPWGELHISSRRYSYYHARSRYNLAGSLDWGLNWKVSVQAYEGKQLIFLSFSMFQKKLTLVKYIFSPKVSFQASYPSWDSLTQHSTTEHEAESRPEYWDHYVQPQPHQNRRDSHCFDNYHRTICRARVYSMAPYSRYTVDIFHFNHYCCSNRIYSLVLVDPTQVYESQKTWDFGCRCCVSTNSFPSWVAALTMKQVLCCFGYIHGKCWTDFRKMNFDPFGAFMQEVAEFSPFVH